MIGPSSRFLLPALLWLAAGSAMADGNVDAADQRALHAAALDYAEGWYSGDRVRMERSLHDALAKRSYTTDKAGLRRLDEMDKQRLLSGNRPENAARYVHAARRAEVVILDGFANVASVKLTMDEWVDYMHLVRDEQGAWRVINVLWERLADDVAVGRAAGSDGVTPETGTGASR